MDFWDLTVLIFRRWKIALPLLLIAVFGTAYVAFTAKPDYVMTSYVQFITPKASPADKDNPAAAALRNPWNQLGLNSFGQAVIYATQDQGFIDSLKATKHTTNFTLTITYPNPIVTVEVVGSTPEDARDTTAMVIGRLKDSAAAMQRQSSVQDADMIVAQRLDQGQNLLPSSSKIKRAIFAVAVAGLIVVAGGTVGFDAFSRRRARKRAEREKQQAEPSSGPPTGSSDHTEVFALPAMPVAHAEIGGPSGETPRPSGVASPPEKPAERPVSLAGAAPSASMERTAIVVTRAIPVAKPPTTPTRPPAATYRSVNAQGEAKDESNNDSVPPPTNGSTEAQSDVRVVLQPKWVGGENGGHSR